MCGRYLTPDEADFERFWRIAPPGGYHRSFNVAPTQLAPIIRARRDGTEAAELLIWGFKPAWASRHWINARSETVFTSPAFKQAARAGRCLVPAAGWYEWQGERAPKQPFVCYGEAFAPIAFAGIWTPSARDSETPGTFAILTRPALPQLAPIHDRMPAVLEPADHAAWLDPASGRDELERALRNAPRIASHRISAHVNKPEHDDPSCIEPLSEPADD